MQNIDANSEVNSNIALFVVGLMLSPLEIQFPVVVLLFRSPWFKMSKEAVTVRSN